LVPLAELVDRVETGKSLGGSAPPAAEGEWGVIKVSSMTWGRFRPEENKRIPDHLANPRYQVRSGDLLVSRANTSAYVGASVVVGDVRPRLLLSDKSLRLVPGADVSASWLNEVLQAPRTRQQISRLATGTKDSMRNISQRALLSVRVPSVSLVEQLEMVARCEESARAIQQLGAAVVRAERRADLLRRSLLAAAFSGRLTGASSDAPRTEELDEVGV
jgi:type I restriction enzyme S subunit